LNYGTGVPWLVGDPDIFLKLALEDKRGAEDLLIERIVEKRGNISSATLRSPISGLKCFLEYNGVQLN